MRHVERNNAWPCHEWKIVDRHQQIVEVHHRRGVGDARAYVTLQKVRGYQTGLECVPNIESITGTKCIKNTHIQAGCGWEGGAV